MRWPAIGGEGGRARPQRAPASPWGSAGNSAKDAKDVQAVESTMLVHPCSAAEVDSLKKCALFSMGVSTRDINSVHQHDHGCLQGVPGKSYGQTASEALRIAGQRQVSNLQSQTIRKPLI